MSKASERLEEWLNTNPANRKIKNPQTGETMEQAYEKMIKMVKKEIFIFFKLFQFL